LKAVLGMTELLFALAAVVSPSPCSGFYSYIPPDREKEVAFSVEVQPTALAISYLDYSRVFAERQNRPDGIIQIYDQAPGGVIYLLACSGHEAFLTVSPDDYHPLPRIYRLARTGGDIWAEAKRRGWPVGD
jgi:hypothetical protein